MRAPLEREQIMEIRINLYEQTGKLDVLTGREKAEMLVSAYRNRMNYVKSGDKIVCDFENIVTATTSFLNQLFSDLRKMIDGPLFVEHIDSAELREDLEAALLFSKAVKGDVYYLVYQDGRDLEILGEVDAASAHTFELLKKQELSARQLADMEDKKLTAASTQLARTYKAGLAFRREIVSCEGKMYVYYIK